MSKIIHILEKHRKKRLEELFQRTTQSNHFLFFFNNSQHINKQELHLPHRQALLEPHRPVAGG